MMPFYALTVAAKEVLTPDSVQLTFTVPRLLRSKFPAKPGQYITLRWYWDGVEVRRSYSLCAIAPDASSLKIAVKRVVQGQVSTFLVDAIAVGDEVEVSTPDGQFVLDLMPDLATKRVFAAAGSGITPIMAQIASVLYSEPRGAVLLVYSNRTRSDMMFAEQIARWSQEFPERFNVLHFITGGADELAAVQRDFPDHETVAGRIHWSRVDEQIRRVMNHPALARYYLCGPETFIEEGKTYLYRIHIPRLHVKYEYFTNPNQQKTNIMSQTSVDAVLKVIIDGEAHEVQVPAGKTILESVIASGLDAPYSCQSGICTTCMAVAEGSFDTSKNIALGPDDFEHGYILTCSTYCTSATGTVNYDEA